MLDGVLLAHRRRDREAVVLAHVYDREVVHRGEVEGLVGVALRAGALAVAGEDDLVGAVHLQLVADTGRAHELGRHRRPARRDVQARVREVAGRLLAAGRRICGLGQHREHQVEGRHAHAQAQHDVAVVGRQPVVLGLQRPADADLGRLVAGARDDEGRPALPVEDLEAVVDLPAQEHEPEPFLERLLVDVGVPPVDRLLEAPVGREGFAAGLDCLRHPLLRCGWRGRRRPSRPPSRPRSTSGAGGCCGPAPRRRPGTAA